MMDQARTVPDDFPTDGVELSCFLVVSDYARALAFYRDVLGATVVRELPEALCFLNFRGSQILLSAPFGPRSDQQAPRTGVICELTMRVPNCSAAYEVLRSRGAQFITPPVEWGGVIRAFFHDPDGHLLEISETREVPERGG
jgi:catechol 2,3-dioxygenase-like lactoylglutathione lyase family enzyme